MEPFLHTDGEAIIMDEAFVPAVKQAFDDAKTNYLKGGPAHTSKTQDWDCGSLFRSLQLGTAMIV